VSAPPRRALRAGNFRISGCGLPKMEDPRSIMRPPPVLLAQNRTTAPKSCKFTHFSRSRRAAVRYHTATRSPRPQTLAAQGLFPVGTARIPPPRYQTATRKRRRALRGKENQFS